VLIECSDTSLACTLAETLQLAALHHVDLSADDATALWRHTGGWATGLALALTWRHADGQTLDLSLFDGDTPAVADYLATEVVTGLDDGSRDVLMRSALSEVVALELVVAVSDRSDAADVLERLARRNTLIGRERGAHGGSGYRYHPILLAYLQAEGRRRDAGAATARHLVASRWYSDRALGAAALEQSLLAHDPIHSLELLERFGLGLILTGEPDLVRRALGLLRGRSDSPATVCLRVLLEPLSDPARRGPHHLLGAAAEAVRVHADRTPNAAAADAWAFMVEILQALYATEQADVAHRYAALQVSALVATARQDPFVDLLAALAEGRCLDRLGQSAAAEDILRQVSEAARSSGLPWLFLQASDLAATAAGHAGNWLHVAMLEGQMAVALTGPPRPTELLTAGLTAGIAAWPIAPGAGRALLYAMIHRYDHCEVLDVDTLMELASPDALMADVGVTVPAEVLLLLSQLDNASHSRQALDRLLLLMRELGAEHPRALSLCCIPLIEVSEALDGKTETQSIVRLIERALGEDCLEVLLIRFLLTPPTRAGHPAEERLRSAALEERTAWRGATIVSAWIALAHVAELTGRHVESDLRLLKGLRLASRIGCERAFLARGGEGLALLRGRLGRLGDLDEYARHVLTAADGTRPDEHPRSLEHLQSPPTLTPREREVLRELPFHQSVANIARKRNVSPNTVKTHLRNIYQKLEAANRADAVAIAHDHGLL
jgi:LuxR family maltose regulon positive regulatory protein